ncbi:hypothetical protein PLICRDRAFT_171338 [Plicaturopsis crispa FD-325 SS-3]|nr:hypothetical protein PLICRDRAFT_171338 [Plicaturopsis crispa FD-325 SS-3]
MQCHISGIASRRTALYTRNARLFSSTLPTSTDGAPGASAPGSSAPALSAASEASERAPDDAPAESAATRAPPKLRVAPIASSFGDISISNFRSQPPKFVRIKPDPAPQAYKADLNWISQASGNSLAARMAARSKAATAAEPPREDVKPNSISPSTAEALRRRLRGEQKTPDRKKRSEDGTPRREGQRVSGQGQAQKNSTGVTTRALLSSHRRDQDAAPKPARKVVPPPRRDAKQRKEAQAAAREAQKKEAAEEDEEQLKEMWTEVQKVGAIDLQETNLTELFSGPSPELSSPVSVDKNRSLHGRVRLVLERAGGDYDRYVPPALSARAGTPLSPVQYAQLTLAKRRGASLRSRRNTLHVIEKFVRPKPTDSLLKV